MAGVRRLAIRNLRGLHARAARRFVETAGRYDAVVEVEKGGVRVPANSVMELLMLAAGQGSETDIIAEGPEEDDALAQLAELVADKFGEGE